MAETMTMAKKIEKNIFILTTPFHLFVAEHMIRNLTSEFSDTENILIFEKQYNLAFSADCWSSVHTFIDIGYSSIGINKKRAAKQNIQLLCNLCAPLPQVTRIFFSNIHYSMINYIFFNTHIRRWCQFAMIMDGVGSYLNYKITLDRYLRDLVKCITGYVGLGIKFHPYLGNYLGDHFKSIDLVFGFQSEYLTCDKNKRKEIPPLNQYIRSSRVNNCIYLDQNTYEEALGYSAWKKMLTTAIKFITAQKFDVLYYKPHPHTHLRPADKQYLEQCGFVIIGNNECIEKLFPALDIAVVVSYTCTSLFILKYIYDDGVKCISLLNHMRHHFRPSVYKQMIKLFAIFKVEII